MIKTLKKYRIKIIIISLVGAITVKPLKLKILMSLVKKYYQNTLSINFFFLMWNNKTKKFLFLNKKNRFDIHSFLKVITFKFTVVKL